MPSDERAASLDQIRQTAATRARATSIRQVAREIGLSQRGFQKFLNGSTPHSATRQKLERWFVRYAQEQGTLPDLATASAALHVLLQSIPPDMEPELAQQVARCVRDWCRERDIMAPEWVSAIQEGSKQN